MDVRGLPDLCHNHLHRVSAIYHSLDSEAGKLAALSALLKETETCQRCQRLRRGDTEPRILNPRTIPSWRGTDLVETRPPDLEFFSSRRKRLEEFERKALFPLPTLSAPLRQDLFRLGPAERNARPGAARLKDGFVLPRVIYLDDEYILKWFVSGFPSPFVRADKVRDIIESPFRMPEAICDRLAAVGETSMSSLEFWIVLRGGERMPCWYGGYNPFIELPQPYRPEDIVDVEISRGSVVREEAALPEPDLVWCVYK